MAKLKILTEQEMLESKKRFGKLLNYEPDKVLLEYTFVNKEDDLLLDEADDDELNNQAPAAPGMEAPAPGMEAPAPGMEAPAPGMEAPAPPMEAPAPGMEAEPAPGMEAEPAPPMEAEPAPEMGDGDEIEVDVTDLTQKQDDVSDKVSDMTSQTQQMMDLLSSLSDKVENIIQNTGSEMNKLKDEIIKRNPTPVEVLQKRITVSDPFNQTPEDYWKKKEADGHYKLEDDEEKELELRGSDINGNASEIYKSFGLTDDEMNQSLATMFR